MAYPILEAQPRPPLDLTPTTRVYSGSFRIGPSGGLVVSIRGVPGEEFMYFLPDASPLRSYDPEPSTWGEVFVVQAVITGDSFPLGAYPVVTAYVPDPRGGDVRWLAIRGHAYAMGGLVLGYRVTVQTPEPPADPPGSDLR